MTFLFTANNKATPPDIRPVSPQTTSEKIADCVVVFDEREGELLNGLKLVNFVVWRRRMNDTFYVTAPNRSVVISYANREMGQYTVLRPVDDNETKLYLRLEGRLGDAILDAFKQWLGSQQ